MIRVFKSGEVARADILYRGESGSTQAVEDADVYKRQGYTLTVAEATPRAVTKVTITRTAEKTADPQPAPEQKRRFGRKKDRDGEK